MKVQKFEDVRRGMPWETSKFGVIETPTLDVLVTLKYNENTKWTNDTLPKEVLEYGKKPPLGIKEIHEAGITGKGINVAIIDQPLALNHPEYNNKIVEYKEFKPKDCEFQPSMHGPGVVSMLVGNNLGTAPDAKVYYAAVPMWLGDAYYETEALNWIMELNEKLTSENKIKFVSISAAPGDCREREKNSEMWLRAVEKAQSNGICVLECTEGNRFVTIGFLNYKTDEFVYGFPNRLMNGPRPNEVHVPNSLRTIAESYDNKHFSYTYNGVGGLSWGIPYAAGVLCLGQQVNCNASALQLRELLIQTAQTNNGVINPKKFLESVKNLNKELK